MLSTIAFLLGSIWVLGLITSDTLGGFIHVLLLLAGAAVLLRIVQRRARSRLALHGQ